MDIRRGDIFYVRATGETEGSEQRPGRPAVIVSNDMCNQNSPVVEVVYLTGQKKTLLPTHVSILAKIPSTALCEQVSSVSVDRLGEFVKRCTKKELEEINKALKISLGISETPRVDLQTENTKLRVALTRMTAERDVYAREFHDLVANM